MSTIGGFIKQLREGKGLSLREAAKRSGLSHSYIDSIEKGMHPKTKAPITPSPESLRSLSKAYNYPYEELMKIAGHIDAVDFEESKSKVDIQIEEALRRLPDDKKKFVLELLKQISDK